MFSSQKRNWCKDNGLKDFLDLVIKVDQKYHQNLIRAFHWYSEAIKETGVDHQLFFIKMVSSVESLLSFVVNPLDSLGVKLSKLIADNFFDETEKSNIESWLSNRNIRKKFENFYQTYSCDFTKTVPQNATHCYIGKEDVGKYVKRVYDARSGYLHCGKPMFISFDMRDEGSGGFDLDPCLGKSVDRKEISGNEKLPRTRWFERITNYCLKNFIKEIVKNEN